MTTKKRAPRATTESAAPPHPPFPIVGIGASADGLAAVEELPKKKLDDFELSLTDGVREPRTVMLNALEGVQAPKKRRLMLLTVTNIDCDA